MNVEPNEAEASQKKITVKEAGRNFSCYHGTLKNAIKDKRLPAEQDGRGTYWLDADEVDRFLRANATIASIFHPKLESGGSGEPLPPEEREDSKESQKKNEKDQQLPVNPLYQSRQGTPDSPSEAGARNEDRRRDPAPRGAFKDLGPATWSSGRNGAPQSQVAHGYPSYQSAVKLLDSMSQKHWLKLRHVIDQRINAWVATI